MSSITNLHQLFQSNERDRIAKEQKAIDRIIDPALPRHTIYKGDRTIQQLGDQPIENGIVLNNQSLRIGDVMLPLAKGNVLRRVDSTNGGALLGTAYRDAVEKDFNANGKRRSTVLSRNGGSEPSDSASPNDPTSSNSPTGSSDRVPPPFGCTPPPSKCIWSSNPIAPSGFQNYGDAVVNENALPVYLHCVAGTSVPSNLNCGFLDPQNWSCSGGICSLNPNGIYASQAQCESALILPQFTGGQGSTTYNAFFSSTSSDPFQSNTNAQISFVTGPVLGWDYITYVDPPHEGIRIRINSANTNKLTFGLVEGRLDRIPYTTLTANVTAFRVERADGTTDTSDNPPPRCPI